LKNVIRAITQLPSKECLTLLPVINSYRQCSSHTIPLANYAEATETGL